MFVQPVHTLDNTIILVLTDRTLCYVLIGIVSVSSPVVDAVSTHGFPAVTLANPSRFPVVLIVYSNFKSIQV